MAASPRGLGRHCGCRHCRLDCGGVRRMELMDNFWFNVIYSVTPTIMIGLIFWFIMRAIVRADRSERATFNEIEREERQKRGLPLDGELLDQREENSLPNS
jgi:flagellar biosynthesis/type III secretory pathway M-ring protein FliF/YscJ